MGIKGGKYYATVPAQAKKSVVQFYVRGRDNEGALSFFPSSGPDSRALYKVDDGLAAENGWHNDDNHQKISHRNRNPTN